VPVDESGDSARVQLRAPEVHVRLDLCRCKLRGALERLLGGAEVPQSHP
jgi:hypothetical protein